MSVESIITRPAVTTSKDASAQEIARLMADEDVGSVIVVEDDDPVGIITDRQLALAVAESPDLSGLDASDLMTEDPVTVRQDTGVGPLIETLAEHGVRRAPVVDEFGHLVGIVSLDDVTAMLGTQLSTVGDLIRDQSPSR